MPSSEVPLTPQTLEGNIAGETETDQEFGPKFGRRSRGARKDDALTSDGLEFADGTENGRYSEHEWRARAREARRADTLATEGGLEGESETRDKYSTKRARRPGMNGKKSGNMRAEGLDFTGGTEQGQFSPKYGRRATRADPRANDQYHQPDGKLEDDTEYTDRFTESAREGSTKAKYKLDQTLITPYGNFASSAVRLGDSRRYNSA